MKERFESSQAYNEFHMLIVFSDLLVLLMTKQQKVGDSALPAIESVSLNGSAGGRSSADDWEGGSLVKIYICSQPTATTTALMEASAG